MKINNEGLITTEPVSFLEKNGISVHVLRLDKIHPVVSGNKWFKLRFYLEEAALQNKGTILTYGGAYSNHILATAFACANTGFKSIGIIRGEAPKEISHTLQIATKLGMEIFFLSREAYKNRLLPSEIINTHQYYTIPEGGYGQMGAAGAATIPYNKDLFDKICCAVGTGTMLSGLINSKHPDAKVLGFSVLKNNFSIEAEVEKLLINKTEKVALNHDFHFGGYAKHKPELIRFMNQLYEASAIPTDFVYTGKLFFGVNKLIEQNYFAEGCKLLLIHSGGLQGNLSLRKGTLIF